MSYMGIDIGTSGCKILVLSKEGKLLSRQSKNYPLISSQEGFFELDAEKVWKAVKLCILNANKEAKEKKDPVAALSFSTQGEAVIPLDKNGKPLALSPVSSDNRGVSYTSKIKKRFGVKKIFNLTGQMPDPIHSIYKILWWRDNDHSVWKKVSKFVCFDTFAMMKFGIDCVTDCSMAARMGLYNINNRMWEKRLLKYTGIKKDKLPKVLETGAYAGTIPDQIAEKYGFVSGVKCYCGAHDQACSTFGAGLVDKGVHYSVGTTECMVLISKERLNDISFNVPTYPGVCKGTYVTLVGSQSGSRVLSWASEVFMKKNEQEKFFDIVKKVKPDYLTDLCFTAHMAGSTLYQDPKSRSSITGISFATTKDDFLKAVLEGITFEQSVGYKKLSKLEQFSDVEEIRIVGGGSRLENWVQIKSDIFNKKFTTLISHDTGAAGAAMIAACGDGQISVEEVIAKFAIPKKTFIPNNEMKDYYKNKESKYCKQYFANI